MSDPLYINSTGSLVPVPAEGIEDAVNLGWVPASPKQTADFETQQKYGSTGQQAIAGIEGVARGATLGLSTAVETHLLKVDPADIAGREQANPWTAGIGEGVGFLAPGGGAGFAMKAGKTAARILGEGAVAKLAGSAVEGAFYGAGHVVHEAALGDPNLTAQSALAQIGMSAALLGGASTAGKVLGAVVREYTPKDLGAKVIDLAREAEAHANFNATNAMPTLIKKTMRGKGAGATAVGLEARELGILRNPLSDSPDAILERAGEVKTSAGQTLDQIARGASQDGAVATWTQIYQDVQGPITKALRSQGATVGLADQFDAFLGKYAEAYAGRDLTVEGLWNLRKDVGDFIYRNGKVLDPWVKELNTPVKRVYDHVDGLLADAVEAATGADGLKAWTKANRAYEVGSTFATLAESGIERSAANNPLHISGMIGAAAGLAGHGVGVGALTGAASEALRRRGASATGFAANLVRTALGDEAEALAGRTAEAVTAARQAGVDATAETTPRQVTVLAALERLNSTTARRIESAAGALIKGETASGIAKVFHASSEDAQATYSKRAAQIRRLSQDPEQLHRALSAQTEDWHTHAPQTAQAMQITSARAVTFLASKLPQPPPMGPLAPKWTPSRDEMAHFNRYYEAVEKPLDVLRQAQNGTLTNEGIEALEAVHPALLQKIRETMTERLGRGPVPYQSRLMLSTLMGQDLDGSLRSVALAHAAQGFAPPLPQAMPSGRAKSLTVSSRTMTPFQRSAERGG